MTRVRGEKAPFTVRFSGERSKRVNGYYRPSTAEITINDGNFKSDDLLTFTALHEYAHHISITELGVTSAKAHSPAFWATFHELLAIADELGIYPYPYRQGELQDATERINALVAESGRIAVELGRELLMANAECDKIGARFDDYVLRELKQSVSWSKACTSAFLTASPSELGPESQKILSSIRNPYTRARIERGMISGMSQAQAKMAASGKPRAEGLDAKKR